MPNPIQHKSKLYYSIGEVAALFGVNSSLIRFYENEFEVIKPHRNKKGNRFFTQSDVDHLTKIFQLVKEEGHSLSKAKELMRMPLEVTVTDSGTDVVSRLKRVRVMLEKLLSTL